LTTVEKQRIKEDCGSWQVATGGLLYFNPFLINILISTVPKKYFAPDSLFGRVSPVDTTK
jgi:hypothetical protein